MRRSRRAPVLSGPSPPVRPARVRPGFDRSLRGRAVGEDAAALQRFGAAAQQQARAWRSQERQGGAGLRGEGHNLPERPPGAALSGIDEVVAAVPKPRPPARLVRAHPLNRRRCGVGVGQLVRQLHRLQHRQIPPLVADQQDRCGAHLLVGRVEPGQRIGPTAWPQQPPHRLGEVPGAGGGHRAAGQFAAAADVVEQPAPPPVRGISWCVSGPPALQQMRAGLDAVHPGPDGPAGRGPDAGELPQRVRRLRRPRGGPGTLRLHPPAGLRRQRGHLQQHHAQLTPSGSGQRPGVPDRGADPADVGHRRLARGCEHQELTQALRVVRASRGTSPGAAGRGAPGEGHHQLPREPLRAGAVAEVVGAVVLPALPDRADHQAVRAKVALLAVDRRGQGSPPAGPAHAPTSPGASRTRPVRSASRASSSVLSGCSSSLSRLSSCSPRTGSR